MPFKRLHASEVRKSSHLCLGNLDISKDRDANAPGVLSMKLFFFYFFDSELEFLSYLVIFSIRIASNPSYRYNTMLVCYYSHPFDRWLEGLKLIVIVGLKSKALFKGFHLQ